MDGTQKRKGSPDQSSSAKRSRNENDSSSHGGSFEKELAAFREDTVAYRNPTANWPRPPVPSLNPSTDKIVFQQLELDHYVGLYMIFLDLT